MGVKSISVSDESWQSLEQILNVLFGEEKARTKKSAVIQTLLNGVKQGALTPQQNLSIDVNNLGVISTEGEFTVYEGNSNSPLPTLQPTITLQPQVNNQELSLLTEENKDLKQQLAQERDINSSLRLENDQLRKQIEKLIKDLKDCRDGCGLGGSKVSSSELTEQLALTQLALANLANSSGAVTNTNPSLDNLELISMINNYCAVNNPEQVIKLDTDLEVFDTALSSQTITKEDFYLIAHLNEVIKGVYPKSGLDGDLYKAEVINAQAYFEQLLADPSLELPQEVETTISVAKELAIIATEN